MDNTKNTPKPEDIQADFNLEDLDLNDVKVLAESDSYALPEAGASIGKFSCTIVITK
ncbi:hypothetical protein Mterra_00607 [Calidithermus terrae]|uniref:Uncharacterized protein n=1 Tax=Calidithermus terrae TaxID=1408545 RepID=A0A399F5T0_9DEIN|nr:MULTISPECIES: hypothetical protein [Calidithermus]RIH90232.1 hypothetical protein Mterra_00607 [Calidithermus terrae]